MNKVLFMKLLSAIIFFLFCSFSLTSCYSQTSFYLKKYSENSSDDFVSISYRLDHDTLFFLEDTYLSEGKKLNYTVLDSSSYFYLNSLFRGVKDDGSIIDSSIYHPKNNIELFFDANINHVADHKLIVFSDTLTSNWRKFLIFFDSLRTSDFVKYPTLNYQYLFFQNINFTSKINLSNKDSIVLSSYETFCIWKQLMTNKIEKLEDFNEKDFEYNIGFYYPIDYKGNKVSQVFFNKQDEIYFLLDDGRSYKLVMSQTCW